MVKNVLCLGCFILVISLCGAQVRTDTISIARVKGYMEFLASDSLKGRGNYTPELYKSALFIAGEFQKAGLRPMLSYKDYFHPIVIKKDPAEKVTVNSLDPNDPQTFMMNVVGSISGRSKPEEVIIFSAHYDHIGVIKGKKKDSIMNGANDNASGTAALLALAHYYSLRGDNERTLVFCAFAGEELGLKGSEYFAGQVSPETIKAVVNLEMIGKANVGRKAFFVTGEQYSNLAFIMKRNIPRRTVRIVLEPSDVKQLFKRSDNYPFALKGIPAHTIMSSDDDDACYHQVCDEPERLDLENMVEIIKAIIQGCQTIISGEDTPDRINDL